MSQAKYITYLLAKHNIDKCSPCAALMIASYHLTRNTRPTLDNASQYRSVIGALQDVTLTTLEIAFPINKLSQFISNPYAEHWQACKRLLRYLKGYIHFGLKFY